MTRFTFIEPGYSSLRGKAIGMFNLFIRSQASQNR